MCVAGSSTFQSVQHMRQKPTDNNPEIWNKEALYNSRDIHTRYMMQARREQPCANRHFSTTGPMCSMQDSSVCSVRVSFQIYRYSMVVPTN